VGGGQRDSRPRVNAGQPEGAALRGTAIGRVEATPGQHDEMTRIQSLEAPVGLVERVRVCDRFNERSMSAARQMSE
jgi:hypothetical protein